MLGTGSAVVPASALIHFLNLNRTFNPLPEKVIMNVIVMNDLNLEAELAANALTETVGGGTLIVSTPWKYLGTKYYFKNRSRNSVSGTSVTCVLSPTSASTST